MTSTANLSLSAILTKPEPRKGPVEIASALQPVQLGLMRVEQKMRTVESSLFAPLASAFVNLIGSGGKRLRPALALMAAQFNGPLDNEPDEAHENSQNGAQFGSREPSTYDRVISLAASVEMLHTATLVHDDVIDGALLRRGAPTLNAVWNRGATVLAGNYMFARAAHFAAETGNVRVIRIFSNTLDTIVNGELRQLFARRKFAQEKSEYYDRIYAKTASLFCAATEAAAVLSGQNETQVQLLRDYGYYLGMAFQIVDDILDFTGDESSLGKPAGSDLLQGTLTLPFFHYLRQSADAPAVIRSMVEAAESAEEGDSSLWRERVGQIVQDLHSGPAVDAARDEAAAFVDQARASLAPLPDLPIKETMLELCDFVVQRTY